MEGKPLPFNFPERLDWDQSSRFYSAMCAEGSSILIKDLWIDKWPSVMHQPSSCCHPMIEGEIGSCIEVLEVWPVVSLSHCFASPHNNRKLIAQINSLSIKLFIG